ncbi:MAG: STAS domain-containing protein [Deferribacteres bacterium]|nr:STAS domain-containing protein [candidate division KSB1 bacterium]MCB9510082.1 STAS domain-containing protein [Deferribacteres bacterium]
MENFQVHLELDGAIATLKMNGDLTHTAEQRLINAYDKCATPKTKHIVLDFSQVEYINSAGMSIIISMLTRAQEIQQEIRACGLSPHFQKIFNMVGLSKYIMHFENLQDALQGLHAQKA